MPWPSNSYSFRNEANEPLHLSETSIFGKPRVAKLSKAFRPNPNIHTEKVWVLEFAKTSDCISLWLLRYLKGYIGHFVAFAMALCTNDTPNHCSPEIYRRENHISWFPLNKKSNFIAWFDVLSALDLVTSTCIYCTQLCRSIRINTPL